MTHDQVEAMTLADKIIVLRDGNVEQSGSPMNSIKIQIIDLLPDYRIPSTNFSEQKK